MSPFQRPPHHADIFKQAMYIFLIVLTGASLSLADQSKPNLPTVIASAVPFYPPVARAAGIDGVIRFRLSTDGSRVSTISVEGGPPLLVSSAEENIRTWRFKEHSPVTFEATFRYKMLAELECEMDSGTVVLRLPSEVEVSAKRLQTCDPNVQTKP